MTSILQFHSLLLKQFGLLILFATFQLCVCCFTCTSQVSVQDAFRYFSTLFRVYLETLMASVFIRQCKINYVHTHTHYVLDERNNYNTRAKCCQMHFQTESTRLALGIFWQPENANMTMSATAAAVECISVFKWIILHKANSLNICQHSQIFC